MKTKEDKILNWYESELRKDAIQLSKEKNKMIEELKLIQKKDIIKEPEKFTIWKRIKRVLGI
jgi:hypothetical protein